MSGFFSDIGSTLAGYGRATLDFDKAVVLAPFKLGTAALKGATSFIQNPFGLFSEKQGAVPTGALLAGAGAGGFMLGQSMFSGGGGTPTLGNCFGAGAPALPAYGQGFSLSGMGGTGGCVNANNNGHGGTATPPHTTVHRTSEGSAEIDTGRYTITVDETNNSQVRIFDKQNGHFINVYGDPHVELGDTKADGSRGVEQTFDISGRTTFVLEDGTKVTLDTEPVDNDPKVTKVGTVTVTTADNDAIMITGVNDKTLGDFDVAEQAGFGNAVDWGIGANRGNVFYTAPDTSGLKANDRRGWHDVDQAFVDETDWLRAPRRALTA
jgi:hypothetical protein